MEVKIFYSWQSDLGSKFNRSFIEKAINKAISNISADEFTLVPVLDRDTKGVSGTPEIAGTIFEKIDKSGLFIGDVSIINSSESGRKVPNPNVLIELGYASSKLGWDRVICLMNTAYGNTDNLPFDLKNRRWPIQYALDEKNYTDDKKKEFDSLVKSIEKSIRDPLASGLFKKNVNAKDVRVADNMEHYITMQASTFSQFLEKNSCTDKLFEILNSPVGDLEDTKFPDKTILDNIMYCFETKSLLSDSNMRIGGGSIPWIEAFLYGCVEMKKGLDGVLDRYSQCDDELIEIGEFLSERARAMHMMFSTYKTLNLDFSNGIKKEQYSDFLRYYILGMMKAKRIIKNIRQV